MIQKVNLDTGIKRRKQAARAIAVLKEDIQAFGLLVEKSLSLEETLQYPITSVPLSLAYPDGHLRQGNKSNLPIHKKENRQFKTNYRPISLLPMPGKILVKIVFDQVYGFFNVNNLLSKGV